MHDRWYSPGQIAFTIPQIKWLLRNWTIIKEGQWPPEPIITGYFDPGGKKLRRKWARFETAAEIWAELDQRMILAGEDGSVLRDVYVIGMTYDQAAMYHRGGRTQIHRRIGEALRLMQGKARSAELKGEQSREAALDRMRV